MVLSDDKENKKKGQSFAIGSEIKNIQNTMLTRIKRIQCNK